MRRLNCVQSIILVLQCWPKWFAIDWNFNGISCASTRAKKSIKFILILLLLLPLLMMMMMMVTRKGTNSSWKFLIVFRISSRGQYWTWEIPSYCTTTQFRFTRCLELFPLLFSFNLMSQFIASSRVEELFKFYYEHGE